MKDIISCMKITIISVGKIKEAFYRDAIAEYSKRLSAYCQLKIIEVADEKTPEQASGEEKKRILNKEGVRILKALEGEGKVYPIALAIDGKQYDSLGFADHLEKLAVSGNGHIVFIIGGSLGLWEEVLNKSKEKLSFSRMTFPHQLMRVILLEQVYRGFRIINHEPYHK